MSKPLTPEQSDAVAGAVLAGRKIEAIKIYREATGVGLAEAKTFVERLEAELRGRYPDRFRAPSQSKGCLGTIACVSAIAALVALAVLLAWAAR